MERNITIIGTGNVGATVAYSLIIGGMVDTLSLVDANADKAIGEAMDLRDGLALLQPTNILAGGYSLCRDAQIIIITAGASQKPGQSRMDLLEFNASIFKEIIPAITRYNREAILLIVTNPVDVMTYLAIKLSGMPAGRVFGTGTVLDTARLRHQLGSHCGIDPRNVHGFVIGEHGEGAIPVWSTTQIAGMQLEEFCLICGKGCNARNEILTKVRTGADLVIHRKGATYYSIALAVKRIVASIIGNENSVLTVSVLAEGVQDLYNVCLGLPALINRSGIQKVLPLKLNEIEKQALEKCAMKLQEAQKEATNHCRELASPRH